MPAIKPPTYEAAFTLIEAIAVIVLIGILAAVVSPIFYQSSEFEARTTRDELIATLRYAQQLAMADNSRTVQFSNTSASYSILIDSVAIALPDGSGMYPRTLANNVTLSPSALLNYSALGDTSVTTFTITTSEKVCVASTGYAYAC